MSQSLFDKVAGHQSYIGCYTYISYYTVCIHTLFNIEEQHTQSKSSIIYEKALADAITSDNNIKEEFNKFEGSFLEEFNELKMFFLQK